MTLLVVMVQGDHWDVFLGPGGSTSKCRKSTNLHENHGNQPNVGVFIYTYTYIPYMDPMGALLLMVQKSGEKTTWDV